MRLIIKANNTFIKISDVSHGEQESFGLEEEKFSLVGLW